MSRPLASEIAPGDVDAVRRVAFALDGIGDDADAIMARLRTLDGGCGPQFWRGDAGDGFRRMLSEIGPEVGKLTLAHRDASDALGAYATALAEAQEKARRAESDWSIADADQGRARNQRARARSEAASEERSAQQYRERVVEAGAARVTAVADPVYLAELDRYETTMRSGQQRAESRATQARGDEAEARQAEATAAGAARAAEILGAQAREIRGDAARTAVALIDDAADLAPSRPSGLYQFFRHGGTLDTWTSNPEFGKWMQQVSDVGGILTSIGSVMSLIPVLQPVGGALVGIGVGLKAVAFVATAFAAYYGNATGKDVAYRGGDLALSLLAGNAGKDGPGMIKRSLWYDDASRATGAWSGVKAAKPLAGRELRAVEQLGRRFPQVTPQRYFTAATSTQVVTTVGNAGTEIGESAGRVINPPEERPGLQNRISSQVITKALPSVINDAAAGAWEYRQSTVQRVGQN